METLYIVIPAYNERDNIENVAREWHQIVSRISRESKLVIIDDGSKDDTYDILLRLQEELPQLLPLTKENGGHGATVLYGYHFALVQGADYIFQTDSDGQTLPEEFWKFWEKKEKYDVLIGNRHQRQDGISRIFVTKMLKLVLMLIFGIKVTDANTPFRLMKREVLKKYIHQIPEDYNLSNVMLTVMFLRGKEKVEFIPITFQPRQGGVNSINFRKISKIGIRAVRDFCVIKNKLKA